MTEKKIRMATPENPEDHQHTIVGGRPQSDKNERYDIPRALEILIKRAAVDEDFKNELVRKRAQIANELSIPLDASEKAILACVSDEHLQTMISATEVPPIQRKLLAGGTAAAMIALLAQLTLAPVPARAEQPVSAQQTKDYGNHEFCKVPPKLPAPGGIRPDNPQKKPAMFDDYSDHLADRGSRPDFPENFIDDTELVTPSSAPEDLPPAFNNRLAINLHDKSFAEALLIIARQAQYRINFSGLDDELEQQHIEMLAKGMNLAEALKHICYSVKQDSQGYSFRVDTDNKAIHIEFYQNKLQDMPTPAKPAFEDPTICRGIRSDMPELRPKKPVFDPGDEK